MFSNITSCYFVSDTNVYDILHNRFLCVISYQIARKDHKKPSTITTAKKKCLRLLTFLIQINAHLAHYAYQWQLVLVKFNKPKNSSIFVTGGSTYYNFTAATVRGC